MPLLFMLIPLIIISVIVISANWDEIGLFFDKRKSFSKRKSEINKLVQMKLISTDSKEIERFIENNVDVLSDKTISKLVSRIESIRLDLIVK